MTRVLAAIHGALALVAFGIGNAVGGRANVTRLERDMKGYPDSDRSAVGTGEGRIVTA